MKSITKWIFLLFWNAVYADGGKKYFFYDVYGPSSSSEEAFDPTALQSSFSKDPSLSLWREKREADHSWSTKIIESVDVSDAEFKQTLDSQKININDTYDHHKYYKSQLYHSDAYWVDLDALNETKKGIVREHPMLSNSYRHAATISLKFDFPFYGHYIKNITIATGGFLYTGDYVHSWLAATQYIAPLMANFDNSQRNSSMIRYADNGTALIVEWSGVFLKSGNATEMGPFSFQVTVHESGDIVFAYKVIPVVISTIDDKMHPVKVGLSDAYIIDRTIFFVRRKTIYEYHRVNLRDSSIANSSAIYFEALPTCNIQQSCEKCLSEISLQDDDSDEEEDDANNSSSAESLKFTCRWCPALKRCSDGMDRYRQSWMKSDCDKFSIVEKSQCDTAYRHPVDYDHAIHRVNYNVDHGTDPEEKDVDHYRDVVHEDDGENDGDGKASKLSSSTHTIAAIVIVCLLVCLIFLWFCYAYVYPHSWSGQILIKYRPTRWQWRRGEPRYTAASIHM